MRAMASGPKLLFVDEGPAWLGKIRANLGEAYEVIAVETGPQALVALEAHPIAVLVTDNHLASVQDRRFGQRLKHHHSALPRIVLSDHPEIERALTERNGNRVDAALSRPCDPVEMRGAIERLVGALTSPDVFSRVDRDTPPMPSGLAPKLHEGERTERDTLPDPFDTAAGDE